LVSAFIALGFVSAASAADMPVKAPVTVAPVYNWTGLYVGATVGYVWGNSQHCDPPGSGFCTADFNVDGLAGGGTLGYNWQMNNWVFGLETDLSGSAAKGTTGTIPFAPLGGPFTSGYGCGVTGCTTSLKWFGTVRGRVGPTFNTWFPYLTGGFAYGGLHADAGGVTGANGTRGGWTIGTGVEYAITPMHWSVKLEYLYFHLGNLFYDTAAICGNLSCTAIKNNFSNIRLGVNYRF
jgi:outer membrane immunogenic protein